MVSKVIKTDYVFIASIDHPLIRPLNDNKYEIVIFVQSTQYFRNFLSKKKKIKKKHDIIFKSMLKKACVVYRAENSEKFKICRYIC